MAEGAARRLRILIANERPERLALLVRLVNDLGHDVIEPGAEVEDIAALTAREHPDLAFVGNGSTPKVAFGLIGQIVHEAACPVIALLTERDPAYVHEAARHGAFSYLVEASTEELECAIDITLQRFGDYHGLQEAFARRALIEQAKGILMARQSIDAETAFEQLRERSQRARLKVADIATAVVQSHLLLPSAREPS